MDTKYAKCTKVYLAGKIGKNDWRHTIFKDLRNYDIGSAYYEIEPVDGFMYYGPFFIGCDHGCYHGNGTHGLGVDNRRGCGCGSAKIYKPYEVVEICEKLISEADIMFSWIDSSTAYGTIVEIGMARAMKKPIFIVCDQELKGMKFIRDMWFACNAATQFTYASCAEDAWRLFVEWKTKLDSGVSRIDIDYATKAQIKYIKSLAKKSKHEFKKDIVLEQFTKGQVGSLINYFTENKPLPENLKNVFEKLMG